MKHITKGNPPQSLGPAVHAVKISPGNQNVCDIYSLLDSATKQDILEACVREQQGLCAYTGLQLKNRSGAFEAHVEHLIPRSVSCPKYNSYPSDPQETVSWSNLVACYPSNPGGMEFGAGKKDDWPSNSDKHLLLSPLHSACEAGIKYRENGKADGLTAAGEETVKRLNLNHSYLKQARKDLIEQAIQLCKTSRHKRLLIKSLEDPNANELPEFAYQRCQVLRRKWAGLV